MIVVSGQQPPPKCEAISCGKFLSRKDGLSADKARVVHELISEIKINPEPRGNRYIATADIGTVNIVYRDGCYVLYELNNASTPLGRTIKLWSCGEYVKDKNGLIFDFDVSG